MEHVSTKHIMPLHALPGDTLKVTYVDSDGVRHVLDAMSIDKPLQIDTLSFFKVKDEHGFKDGIAAMLGECDGKW